MKSEDKIIVIQAPRFMTTDQLEFSTRTEAERHQKVLDLEYILDNDAEVPHLFGTDTRQLAAWLVDNFELEKRE